MPTWHSKLANKSLSYVGTNLPPSPGFARFDMVVFHCSYVPSKCNSLLTPRAHARARGYVIGIYIIYCLDFFWNQSFISKITHFEMSILTQIGFSSNLMASGTVQQLDKSSWPSQIPIVCRLGKGSPMPETHVAPNHTPTIAVSYQNG